MSSESFQEGNISTRNKPFFIIFALTAFLSAFLLFLVQPLIAKKMLPHFGGATSVWTSALLFFQVVLLLGYVYALLLSRLPKVLQILIHSIVVACTSTFVIARLYGGSMFANLDTIPSSLPPILQIIVFLAFSIGPVFFLLSTSSTLLQHWFASLPSSKNLYKLYAFSNAGSLLAIFAYPFIIEPRFTLATQTFVWGFAFLFVAIALVLCGLLINQYQIPQKIRTSNMHIFSRKTFALWMAIPAVTAALLAVATHELTQAVAAVPFLWLVPLGLYLLSFIYAFSTDVGENKHFFSYTFIISFFAIMMIRFSTVPLNVLVGLGLYSVLLFSGFVVCHSIYYRLRPKSNLLPVYYAAQSVGSALGTLFVVLISPLVFKHYTEFFISLFIVYMIVLFPVIWDEKSLWRRLLRRYFATSWEAYTFAAILFISLVIGPRLLKDSFTSTNAKYYRNFYGTLAVVDNERNKIPVRLFISGGIVHSLQGMTSEWRNVPVGYYAADSAVGEILSVTSPNRTVAVLGLGGGTLMAFAKEGDYYRFYEINPLVVDIAKSEFTYLSDTNAKYDIVLGDGRKALEEEIVEDDPVLFDVIVLDAFSDDSIPVHLMTAEAFDIYKRRLKNRDSVIAVNISNRYIDLTPLLIQIAKHHNLEVRFSLNKGDDGLQFPSHWAILSPSLESVERCVSCKTEPSKEVTLWTDDFSNLLQVLK